MKAYEGNEKYIFVSYSHKDAERVLPIVEAMRDKGFRIWYDLGTEAGTEWPAYIEDRLRRCDAVLIFISPDAVDSENCRNEINFACKHRKKRLVVYLQQTELKHGMDLQLGTSQSIYRERHPSLESFVEELGRAQILLECKGAVSSSFYDTSLTNTKRSQGNAQTADEAQTCYEEGLAYYKKNQYRDAVVAFRIAAEAGHREAQYHIGECYYYGHGVAQDYSQAVVWYRKAAEQGHATAQNDLGYCYKNGKGVPQDYSQAVIWYRKSAEQGNAQAQNNLGHCYKNGQGVPQDDSQAVVWYRKSAEQGYALAQYHIGDCYYYGHGVAQDYAQAVAWYRKAAEQGNVTAQNDLGYCYKNGKGVPQDYSQAVAWYQKAAEQGHATAQNNLGICYENGQGVSPDVQSALYWYRKAAEQGHAKAAENVKRLGG